MKNECDEYVGTGAKWKIAAELIVLLKKGPVPPGLCPNAVGRLLSGRG